MEYQKGIITHLKKLNAVRKDQLWNGIRVMVGVGNVSNFDWLVQLLEQWHRERLMIDYSIQTISFIGLNVICGVIGMKLQKIFVC